MNYQKPALGLIDSAITVIHGHQKRILKFYDLAPTKRHECNTIGVPSRQTPGDISAALPLLPQRHRK